MQKTSTHRQQNKVIDSNRQSTETSQSVLRQRNWESIPDKEKTRYSRASRPVLGPTQCVPEGGFFHWHKLDECDGDNLLKI